ncbi:MAG: hypothetical protein R3D25_21535 [Geminicoccaceae bacterium]
MSPRTLALGGALQAYLDELGGREHPVLARLRAATDRVGRWRHAQLDRCRSSSSPS